MAENAAAVANDPSAPTAERHDAEVEFRKSHGTADLAAELFPSAEMEPVIARIQDIMAEQDLNKAARGNLIVGPWAKKRQTDGAQSVTLDDFQIQTQGPYWDRPGILGFDSMRAMVEQTPILNSIVLTRIRQVNRFCRPRMGNTGPGFVIEHVDPSVELNDEQQKSVQLLQRFMINGGWETDPRRRKRLKRDPFSRFMAKSVRDTLTLDAAPIETEFKRDVNLGIDGFYALDGATIRLCTEQGYEGDDEVFALQVIQGNIRTAYTYNDLVYEVRNPRTDVTACGYGYSETEMLIRIVTYLLNAMTFNGSFFDSNSIPRGILQLYGAYDPSDIAAMKRQWNAMCRGIQNSHNLPLLISKDQESGANFTEVGGQLDEMAFAKWMTFLTAIACAIYGTAPEEISMESFATTSRGLGGNDTEEKLVSANDKGLAPLLGFYEDVFSDFILQPFSPQYMFRFKGLDDEDGKQRFERQKLTQTWNEMRAVDGMDPIEGPMGDAPLNPVLSSLWAAENDVGQPEQPEEDFGDPGAAAGDEAGFEGRDDTPDEQPADGEGMDFGEPADADEASDGPDLGKALTAERFGMPIFAIEA